MTGRLTYEAPWLSFDLDAPHRVLSWAINRPGFVSAQQILWREVRNADLPPDLDVDAWLQGALVARNSTEAVTFLTSRDLAAHHDVTCQVDGVSARCVATVGLSNAERVGARMDRSAEDWGTINMAVVTSCGMTDSARIEALSIAAQARTTAILDARLTLPTGCATGTGTDCIAIAAPEGTERYAGLHTALGEAVGASVMGAVSAGVAEWMASVKKEATT